MGAELNVVLDEEDGVKLGEVDLGIAGDGGVLGGGSAGQAEQGAAVLLQAGDGGGGGGGVVVGVEDGSGASAKDVAAVEVVGEGLVFDVVEELEAGFEVVLAAGKDDVVIPLCADLADALRADLGSATGEGSGDFELLGQSSWDCRSRRESRY